uniref:Uncharacterized protein n=1 Tax=Lepeophtheirus salmonis TaxID=72036 RepID=A0A0K2T4I5_LEPSM
MLQKVTQSRLNLNISLVMILTTKNNINTISHSISLFPTFRWSGYFFLILYQEFVWFSIRTSILFFQIVVPYCVYLHPRIIFSDSWFTHLFIISDVSRVN